MKGLRKAASPAEKKAERDLAWMGDGVLELFCRGWILKNHGALSGEMVKRMTSNQFLATLGNPTAIEARIGQIYEEQGLEAAFGWIETEILPFFQKQERNRR